MQKYRVTCYARKVGAIGQLGTETVVVEVEAATAHRAREAAIDAVYALRTDLEHVASRVVQEWLE